MIRQIKIQQKITDREETSLSRYLLEIRKIDKITPEEEVKLAKRIRGGDVSALHKLCEANLRFVVSVAKQYQNQWMPLPDLINQGNLWLIIAAKRFDEKKWFKFISYAVRRIRQRILEGLAENSRTIRMPINKIWDLNAINKTSNALEQELGREATSEEIAEVINIDTNSIKEIKHISKKTLLLNDPIGEDHSDGTYIDFLRSEEKENADYRLYIESLKREITRAIATLSDREQKIIKLYFGIDCEIRTVDEIAQTLNISNEVVRYTREKAILKLKTSPTAKHLKQFLW